MFFKQFPAEVRGQENIGSYSLAGAWLIQNEHLISVYNMASALCCSSL